MLYLPFPHFSHTAAAYSSLLTSLPAAAGKDVLFLFLFVHGEGKWTWREMDGDLSALAHLTLKVNLTLVLADNAVGHGESETYAFSFSLGCIEWLENSLNILLWDARPCITDPDLYSVFLPVKSGGNGQFSALWHCLNSIPQDINEGLLQSFEIT